MANGSSLGLAIQVVPALSRASCQKDRAQALASWCHELAQQQLAEHRAASFARALDLSRLGWDGSEDARWDMRGPASVASEIRATWPALGQDNLWLAGWLARCLLVRRQETNDGYQFASSLVISSAGARYRLTNQIWLARLSEQEFSQSRRVVGLWVWEWRVELGANCH